MKNTFYIKTHCFRWTQVLAAGLWFLLGEKK